MAGRLQNYRRVRSNRFDQNQLADINITPFVDVMLVLLIVFMISAPLLNVSVPVDLPQTEAAQANQPDEPLIISIDKSGHLFLQEKELAMPKLIQTLKSMANQNKDLKIYIRGDKALAYGDVMQVMGKISAAGFQKVALVTENPKK